MNRFNTSRAVQQAIDIFNYDGLPLSLTFTDPTIPGPIDLTGVQFDFYLELAGREVAHYTIAKNSMTSTYLAKSGTDDNVLNMQAMWEDIRDNKMPVNGEYRLIQVVNDAANNVYVQVVYQINVNRY